VLILQASTTTNKRAEQTAKFTFDFLIRILSFAEQVLLRGSDYFTDRLARTQTLDSFFLKVFVIHDVTPGAIIHRIG
jgi:hypothetical protein